MTAADSASTASAPAVSQGGSGHPAASAGRPGPAGTGFGAWAAALGGGRGLLLLALALGLLRFVRLGEWSLWFDEIATWTDAHHGLEGGQINNPLGYRLIAATAALFGTPPDELTLRFLPALVGWAVVPLTWFVFRPLYGGRAAGGAALLVAVSTWQISWSQTARFYTMAQAVALVGSGLALSGFARGSVSRAVIGLVFTACAFFFHPSGLLMLPALVVAPWVVSFLGAPIVKARRPAYVLLACSIVAVVLVLPSALETWNWYSRQKGHGGGLAERLPWVAHYLKTTGFYVTPLLGVGAFVGALFAWRRRDALQLAAPVIVLLSLAAALTASVFVRISAQYVFVTLPWICLLAVLPFASEPGTPEGPQLEPAELGSGPAAASSARLLRLAWLVILVVPALVTTGLYLTVRQGERPPWRDAYRLVWNRRGPNDLVLGMEASVGEFYLDPRETSLRETRSVAWLDKFRAHRPERWARHPRGTWYVINPEQLFGWRPKDADALRRHLREECRLVKCFPLYVESRDLSVWVYVRS